ncbi:MAG: glycosyltransferase family 2 protein [Dysgonomonas sp.]
MKLSIITINLNNSSGLLKTIESVENQTFRDFEFIVIDGGSKDNSVEHIKKYEDKISYWISEPDKGIYNAMNKGIAKATGEYCYFLNSGDFLIDNSVLERVFQGNTSDSFICGNYLTEENHKLVTHNEYKIRDWKFSLYDIFSGFLAHQAFFIKRTMFEKYGYYDERFKIMSDWKLFFLAIGVDNEKVFYKDVNICVYDTQGISSRIGGTVIYDEKTAIAKEELSPYLYNKLDRLYYLDRYGFITDFVLNKKWFGLIFRIFYKLTK